MGSLNELMEIAICEGLVVGKDPECIEDLFDGASAQFQIFHGKGKYPKAMELEANHKCLDYIYFNELPNLVISNRTFEYQGIFKEYDKWKINK